MPTGTPMHISDEFLRREYLDNQKSCSQIAREVGCEKSCITKRIKKLGIPLERRGGGAPHKLIGRTFEKLRVVEYAGTNRHKQTQWKCVCECGNETVVLGSSLTSGHTRSCGCRTAEVKKLTRKTVGGITSAMWQRVLYGARQRGLKLEITQEQAWDLFVKQGGVCALSGAHLTMPEGPGHELLPTGTASLDRIDSSLGYSIDNVQWVHKEINKIKMNLSEERFIELCLMVAVHNGRAKVA